MAEFILSVIWNSLGMDFISLCYFKNLSRVAMWYANSSVYGWLEMLHLKNQIQLNQLITKVRDQYSAHSLPCYFAEKSKRSEHIVSQPINNFFCPKKTAGPRKHSQVIKYSLESLNIWAQFLPFHIFLHIMGQVFSPLRLVSPSTRKMKAKLRCCMDKFSYFKKIWGFLNVLLWTDNAASACCR